MGIAETENTVNVPLLRKAVEWVEEQAAKPEIDREWMQSNYVASPMVKTVRMLNERLVTDNGVSLWEINQVAAHCGTAYCVAGYIGQMHDERYAHSEVVEDVHVRDYAQQKLGLNIAQAGALFSGSNSAWTIRALAEGFAGEPL